MSARLRGVGRAASIPRPRWGAALSSSPCAPVSRDACTAASALSSAATRRSGVSCLEVWSVVQLAPGEFFLKPSLEPTTSSRRVVARATAPSRRQLSCHGRSVPASDRRSWRKPRALSQERPQTPSMRRAPRRRRGRGLAGGVDGGDGVDGRRGRRVELRGRVQARALLGFGVEARQHVEADGDARRRRRARAAAPESQRDAVRQPGGEQHEAAGPGGDVVPPVVERREEACAREGGRGGGAAAARRRTTKARTSGRPRARVGACAAPGRDPAGRASPGRQRRAAPKRIKLQRAPRSDGRAAGASSRSRRAPMPRPRGRPRKSRARRRPRAPRRRGPRARARPGSASPPATESMRRRASANGRSRRSSPRGRRSRAGPATRGTFANRRRCPAPRLAAGRPRRPRSPATPRSAPASRRAPTGRRAVPTTGRRRGAPPSRRPRRGPRGGRKKGSNTTCASSANDRGRGRGRG